MSKCTVTDLIKQPTMMQQRLMCVQKNARLLPNDCYCLNNMGSKILFRINWQYVNQHTLTRAHPRTSTRMHTHTPHPHTNSCAHMHTPTPPTQTPQTHMHMHACTHPTHKHARVHTNTHPHTCTHTRVRTHTCTHPHACAHARTCACACTHKHAHTESMQTCIIPLHLLTQQILQLLLHSHQLHNYTLMSFILATWLHLGSHIFLTTCMEKLD